MFLLVVFYGLVPEYNSFSLSTYGYLCQGYYLLQLISFKGDLVVIKNFKFYILMILLPLRQIRFYCYFH
jgi:hypothetical protein